jgi:hypothetical protein
MAQTHKIMTRFEQRNPPKPDTWSDWKPPNLVQYFFLLEKKNGVINIKRRTPAGITPINCSEVPR